MSNFVLTKNNIYSRKKIARELLAKAGMRSTLIRKNDEILNAMVDAEISERESIYTEEVTADPEVDVKAFTPAVVAAGIGLVLSLLTVIL